MNSTTLKDIKLVFILALSSSNWSRYLIVTDNYYIYQTSLITTDFNMLHMNFLCTCGYVCMAVIAYGLRKQNGFVNMFAQNFLFVVVVTFETNKRWRYVCCTIVEEIRINKLTPMIRFNSCIVTCFARSTAFKTCCWWSACRNGSSWFIKVFKRLAISVCT